MPQGATVASCRIDLMSYELMIVHSLGSASQWSLPNNIK
jgi:hypothetical protein